MPRCCGLGGAPSAALTLLALATSRLPPTAVALDPDFCVEFQVQTKQGNGSFVVGVHETWAPIGAARFKALVEDKFYDNTRFYRVIPSFMVQFGLSGDPAQTAKWAAKSIADDPVIESNRVGKVSFAMSSAPNSRTTQIFINYKDNLYLDGSGFAPFAQVLGRGMDVVRQIFDCGEAPDQGQINSKGNAYLDAQFPNLSKIYTARVTRTEDCLQTAAIASGGSTMSPLPEFGTVAAVVAAIIAARASQF